MGVTEKLYTAELVVVCQPAFDNEGRWRLFDTVEVRNRKTGGVVARFLVESCEETLHYNRAVSDMIGTPSFGWIG